MKFEPRLPKLTSGASSGATPVRHLLYRFARIAAIILVAYALLGLAADQVALRMPDEWERSLTANTDADQESEEETKLLQRPREIFEKMSRGEGLRNLPHRLVITDRSSGPNAFAFPGGRIGLTRDLISEIKTEEGLAFVMAHELAHHEYRHILRQSSRKILLAAALALLGADASSAGLDIASSTTELAYSREQESEADEFAVDLVVRKFPNPEMCLEFFDLDFQSQPMDSWPQWARTHPSRQLRRDNIERWIRQSRQLGRTAKEHQPHGTSGKSDPASLNSPAPH